MNMKLINLVLKYKDDWDKVGKVILGLIGGFILLDILSNKCK